MASEFIHNDFLLQTEAAKQLYHQHAAKMPIYDYHCHLPPVQVADDVTFENIPFKDANNDATLSEIKNFFNNSASQFASFFTNETNLSLTELEELKKIVEKKIENQQK